MIKNTLYKIISIALLTILLLACDNGSTQEASAPLNDKETLEKLASAYESISENLPTSPASLRPEARKKFVVDVFENAGFNYSETLNSLAGIKGDNVTQYHIDMKELLFLPHHGFRLDDVKSIYTEDEINSIIKIAAKIK